MSKRPREDEDEGEEKDHTPITTPLHSCSACRKHFPTPKLLDVHIAENHDPFTKIRLERGEPVFACFAENCDRLFSNHRKRRLHLIDKHHYPKDYIFSVVDRGVPRNGSLIKKNTRAKGIWKPA